MFIGLIVYLVYLCVSCLAEIEGGGVNLVDRRSGVRDALMPIICSVNSGVEPVWALHRVPNYYANDIFLRFS